MCHAMWKIAEREKNIFRVEIDFFLKEILSIFHSLASG